MKQAILELLNARGGGVSFIELERSVPGFTGKFTLSLKPNLILWHHISKEGDAALNELLKEKKIVGQGAAPLVYFVDGCVIDLPFAKALKAYKHPHWWPVVFSTAEQLAAKKVRA